MQANTARNSTGPKGRFSQPRPKGLGKLAAIMFLGRERGRSPLLHVGFIPHIAVIARARKYGEKRSTGPKGRFYQPRPKGLGKISLTAPSGPRGFFIGTVYPALRAGLGEAAFQAAKNRVPWLQNGHKVRGRVIQGPTVRKGS